jgi:hypothetical protein
MLSGVFLAGSAGRGWGEALAIPPAAQRPWQEILAEVAGKWQMDAAVRLSVLRARK